MTIQDCLEIMPKWLGQPMYFGGVPMKPDDYIYEGVNLISVYYRHSGIDPIEFGERKDSDENLLIAYTLYYINAPIFDSEYTDELRAKAKEVTSFDDLWRLCLDYGLDPF